MLIFDLESDGLLPELTRIHCLWIYDTHTHRYHGFDKKDVPKGLDMLAKADAICGHNIIAFDIPAIKKVYPEWTFAGEVYDTMVWARLVFADIKESDYGRHQKGQLPGKLIGSHSLKAWGNRLGEYKGDFAEQTDWSEWTPEMSAYCKQDVNVTKKLFELVESRTFTMESVHLEHQVQWILARQERHGFYFDAASAVTLYGELAVKKAQVEQDFRDIFPPFYVQGKEFIPKADNKKYGYVKGCPMTKVHLKDFNPNSGTHVYWALKRKYGWKPTEFTEKGQVKVDEDILAELGKKWPEAKKIQEYWTLDKRMGQIQDGDNGWLKHYNRETGRIHGYVNHCGAVTGRMTHSKPNTAQVPSNDHLYGEECRSLFTVPEGYKLVGCDADGLEGRCLAHFLARYDDGAFIKTILEGSKEDKTDMHNVNKRALEITDRGIAKRWFYAWMYGAGIKKLAAILGVKQKDSKEKNQKFLDNFPAMKKLKAAIEKAVNTKGYLKGLDGRKLRVRSPHSALNTLLQSAGALIMKKALVILDKTLQDKGLIPGQDYEFVANVHDEWQIEVLDAPYGGLDEQEPYSVPEVVGQTAAWAIEEAGKHFGLRCPLAGDYNIGTSWKETH